MRAATGAGRAGRQHGRGPGRGGAEEAGGPGRPSVVGLERRWTRGRGQSSLDRAPMLRPSLGSQSYLRRANSLQIRGRPRNSAPGRWEVSLRSREIRRRHESSTPLCVDGQRNIGARSEIAQERPKACSGVRACSRIPRVEEYQANKTIVVH